MEIQILYQQGKSLKTISRETGYSINTVRKYVRDCKSPIYKPRPDKPTKLDAYKDYLQRRVREAAPIWLPATVLEREIVLMGYSGKISTLRQYLRTLKPEIKESKIVRFETAAGEQMQVDWAEIRRGRERLCAFVATLGHSRVSYVEFVTNEKLETLISCHENAFAYFGGVPKTVLYDNMRTVIVERDAYGEGKHRLQSGFWDFAKHYNFIPKVCRPYRPQTKGKVERFIHYLKNSFYNPLLTKLKANDVLLDDDTANIEVIKWLKNVADLRVHGTTGKIPGEVFQEEQKHLQALPPPYNEISRALPSATQAVNWQMLEDAQEINIQHPLSIYEQLIPQGVPA